jgi:hypothetical protein
MSFATRRTELLAAAAGADLLKIAAEAGGRPRTAVFGQLARVVSGLPLTDAVVDETVAILQDRIDCADFTLAGILRILTFDGVAAAHRERLQGTVLGFKYWWSEPGVDGMCYHTENHQILFHSAELLAGEASPEAVFTNSGRTGKELAEHALPLVKRWLRLRSEVGWSEWLSNTYLEHNLLALLNLYDFAADEEVRRLARGLADVLLVELALHSKEGVFGSTHGRAYPRGLVDGFDDGTATLSWLLFGTGRPHDLGSVGAMTLATSNYEPPEIVWELVKAPQAPETIKQRMSFDVDDAARLGLGYDSEDSAQVFWAMQEFMHPKVLPLTRHLLATYALGLDTDPIPYVEEYRRQEKEYGRIVDPWRDRHALSEVNLQTYRGRHVMLSTAQSYRPGRPGYQHHIWQATLGPRAVVFTNHPGSADLTSRPNRLAGNHVLPRAVQHHEVTICLHQVPADAPFPFSHAYFPFDEFDEVVVNGHWWFARSGQGHLGLWCSDEPVRGESNELRASSPSAAWICEVGEDDFADFTEKLSRANVGWRDGQVEYESPTRGRIAFSWDGPLLVDGVQVAIDGYPRLDSPYGRVELGERTWQLTCNGIDATIDVQERM